MNQSEIFKTQAKSEVMDFMDKLKAPWYTMGVIPKILYILAHLSLFWLVIRLFLFGTP